MGSIPHASLKWCEELNQGELHDLKAPPLHYYLVSVNDKNCSLIDTTHECEHVDP